MNPLSILLIDDNPAYCLELQEVAKHFRFNITFFHNLEDGMEALTKSRRLKAVILDDRCLLEPGQPGAARSNFVFHALQQLRDIEHHYNRAIPFCVNSENPAEFREDLEGISRVFVKKNEHDQMFRWLKDSIEQLPETAIRKEFYGIFEKMDAIFNEEQQELLIDVLQGRVSAEPSRIVTNMAILRRLLEDLVNAVCLKKPGKPPAAFDTGTGSRTRRILEAMRPRILPDELFVQANQLYKTCSRYGNHVHLFGSSVPCFSPGKYTLARLVYAFLEIADYLLADPSSS